ncbi:MAG: hypothetical protein HUU18_05220 [Phycisphaerales bacterium]|nr:hypothetical protein [Phycisphaerales bacterium]
MNDHTPDRPAPKDKSHRKSPQRADGYDFMSLYTLSDAELERRIMTMDDDEYAAFSKWHDARIRKTLLHYRRKLPPKEQERIFNAELRRSQPMKLRSEGEPSTRLAVSVMDYLSGMHPLVCRSQEDREDLATVRAIADIIMEIMVENGITDRHDAANIMEMRHAEAVRAKRAARKPRRKNSRPNRTGRTGGDLS